jgi:hypothetical protein
MKEECGLLGCGTVWLLLRADVSEDHVAFIILVTRIIELETTLAVSSNRSTLRLPVVFLRSVLRLLLTANVVPSSPILVTLMMEAILSSETSVLTRATRRNFSEDGILHSHRSEASNLTKIKELYMLTSSLYIFLCDSHNKQRLLPQTAVSS